jgi:deazaflavin-dependent oxidoreductase (nitroreductase family)
MTGNDFVKFFLRTPLYVFMGDTMLITVTGCKTGTQYTTPVGFYRENGILWIMTSRERTWWRNVRNGAEVSLLLKGKKVRAFAQAELDEGAVEQHLRNYIRQIPMTAKSMGIQTENGIPDDQDIRRLARERLFVQVRLI